MNLPATSSNKSFVPAHPSLEPNPSPSAARPSPRGAQTSPTFQASWESFPRGPQSSPTSQATSSTKSSVPARCSPEPSPTSSAPRPSSRGAQTSPTSQTTWESIPRGPQLSPTSQAAWDTKGNLLKSHRSKRTSKNSNDALFKSAPAAKRVRKTTSRLSDKFSRLPDEMMIQIFSYLSPQDLCIRLSLTCQRFKNLVMDKSLWTRLVISTDRNTETAERVIIQKCGQLKKISLGIRLDSCKLAVKALKCCPKLEELLEVYIGGKNTMKRLLQAIGHLGLTLRRVQIYHCDVTTISQMAGCLRNLTEIELENTYGGSQSGILRSVGTHCTKVKKLTIGKVTGINDDEFIFFLTSVKDTIEYLKMSVSNEIRDESLKILGYCHRLQTLIFYPFGELGPKGLKAISRLKNLRCLKVMTSDNTLKGSEIVKAFADLKMANLTSLHLFLGSVTGLFDPGFETIAENCSNLKGIKIDEYCVYIYQDISQCMETLWKNRKNRFPNFTNMDWAEMVMRKGNF